MKYPKKSKRYCPRCQKHTDHNAKIYKKAKDRKMASGNRKYRRAKRGYGSQPKPIQHSNGDQNKRCRNDRLKSLGFEFQYPDYQAGYSEMLRPLKAKILGSE